MYLGTQEIKEINDNTLTFTNGDTLVVEEINKDLISNEAITGSELQMNWARQVATQIIDVYYKNNVRLTDIQLINELINGIIIGKNEEALVSKFNKQNLDIISGVFGANEKLASISSRNIRMKDIFNI